MDLIEATTGDVTGEETVTETSPPEVTKDTDEVDLNKIVAVAPIVKKTEPLEQTDPDTPGVLTVDQGKLQGQLLKTYFELDSKIGSHIETYNNWLENILPVQLAGQTLQTDKGIVTFSNPKYIKPRSRQPGGAWEELTPRMARDNMYTYAFELYADATITREDGSRTMVTNVLVGKIPSMLGSRVCHLDGLDKKQRAEVGECNWDPLGYFIVKGSEKVVLTQEKLRSNRIMIFNSTNKGNAVCKMSCRTVNSYSNVTLISGPKKQIEIHLPFMGKMMVETEEKEPGVFEFNYVNPKNKKVGNTISVFQVYRLLGVTDPKTILQYIALFTKPKHRRKISILLQNTFAETLKIGDDIEYIATKLKGLHDLPTEISRSDIIKDLKTQLFPQIPASGPDEQQFIRQKLFMLSMMVVKFSEYLIGERKLDDRDNVGNKQLVSAGKSVEDLFGRTWKQVIEMANAKSPSNLASAVNSINASFVTDTFQSSFNSANWGVKGSNMKENITEPLERKSALSPYSHLTRIISGSGQGKNVKPRLVDMSQLGYICPIETPEGGKCGVVKNGALTLYISVNKGENKIISAISKYLIQQPTAQASSVFILNGKIEGWCIGNQIRDYLVYLRRTGYIRKDIAVILDRDDNNVYVYTGGGRATRPLLIVDKDGELVIKKKNLWNADMEALLREGCVEYVDALEQEYIQLAMYMDDVPTRRAEMEEANQLHQDAIERLAELEKTRDDPELLRTSNIFDIEASIASAKEAISQAAYSVKVVPQYTHCEMDPTAIMGLSASLIPLSNHNQAPRNTYQCKMASQSMGIYHSQNYTRFDTTAKCLAYPTPPLFETQMNEILGLNELPAGSTVILAIMTLMGYNQEDAIIMNQASVDRGLFRQVVYKTYKSAIKIKQSSIEQFTRPPSKPNQNADVVQTIEEDIRKTEARIEQLVELPEKDMATRRQIGKLRKKVLPELKAKKAEAMQDRYHAINDEGFPIAGRFVREGDCVIGKIRQDRVTGEITDASVYVDVGVEGTINRVLISTNPEGLRVVKVKLMQVRKPVIGDKFASRHAQKATLGMILPYEDMPYSLESGVVPDIIINPHCIPSRMTMAKMIEVVASKIAAFQGERVNATAYRKFDIKEFKENLRQYGYSPSGKETLINGMTGKRFQARIFTGPCYYQALQHNVKDKFQARGGEGPVQRLTQQPVGGRKQRGGQRFGEMERDAVISHGATAFLHERLCQVSDPYKAAYCTECNTLAVTEQAGGKLVCEKCVNPQLGTCTIPRAYKLLAHNLAGAGFKLTLGMKEAEEQPVKVGQKPHKQKQKQRKQKQKQRKPRQKDKTKPPTQLTPLPALTPLPTTQPVQLPTTQPVQLPTTQPVQLPTQTNQLPTTQPAQLPTTQPVQLPTVQLPDVQPVQLPTQAIQTVQLPTQAIQPVQLPTQATKPLTQLTPLPALTTLKPLTQLTPLPDITKK